VNLAGGCSKISIAGSADCRAKTEGVMCIGRRLPRKRGRKIAVVLPLALALILLTPTSRYHTERVSGQKRAQTTIKVEGILTFQNWKLEKKLAALVQGAKLQQLGVAPKTKEEADAYSIPVRIEGGGVESLPLTDEEREARKFAYVYDQLPRWQAEREAQQEAARTRERCRIWLERNGSPLAPYTAVMEREAVRVGSTIYMCPAVAMKESSGGLAPYITHYNCWGLMGYAPQSYEEGISNFYQFLYDFNISRGYAAVDGDTTPNYCVPWPGSWAPEVNGHIAAIKAVNVP